MKRPLFAELRFIGPTVGFLPPYPRLTAGLGGRFFSKKGIRPRFFSIGKRRVEFFPPVSVSGSGGALFPFFFSHSTGSLDSFAAATRKWAVIQKTVHDSE